MSLVGFHSERSQRPRPHHRPRKDCNVSAMDVVPSSTRFEASAISDCISDPPTLSIASGSSSSLTLLHPLLRGHLTWSPHSFYPRSLNNMKFLLPTLALIGLASALALPEAAGSSLEKKASSSDRLLKLLARNDVGWCIACGLQFGLPGGACVSLLQESLLLRLERLMCWGQDKFPA